MIESSGSNHGWVFDSEAETRAARAETFVSEISNGSRKKARQAWRRSHELLRIVNAKNERVLDFTHESRAVYSPPKCFTFPIEV